jgi:hypothetical protein
MHDHEIPDFIISRYGGSTGRPIVDQEFLLLGAGRDIAFVRMAADALEDSDSAERFDPAGSQRSAEYHVYAGISAARSALDALSAWLNHELALGCTGAAIDLNKRRFRERLRARRADIADALEPAATLVKEIDRDRQRVQHREGSALTRYVPGVWHITDGLLAPRDNDRPIVELLRGWADRAEELVRVTVLLVDQPVVV